MLENHRSKSDGYSHSITSHDMVGSGMVSQSATFSSAHSNQFHPAKQNATAIKSQCAIPARSSLVRTMAPSDRANPIFSNARYPQLSDRQTKRYVSETRGTYGAKTTNGPGIHHIAAPGGTMHTIDVKMPLNRRKTSKSYQ